MTPRQQMERAIRDSIDAGLRPAGFTGSFPHLRRVTETQIELLSYQFHSAGGSFVVEVARCGLDGITTYWGQHIEPKKVTARDVGTRRPRLGSDRFPEGDHWFEFGPRSYADPAGATDDPRHYASIAAEVIRLIESQAVPFWTADHLGRG